ncbi:MAG: chloramphenicol acetyltransferase [Flavobacterium sp.]|nr:chloramphenicol acetyltransferase [Flavobacterium sp.]
MEINNSIYQLLQKVINSFFRRFLPLSRFLFDGSIEWDYFKNKLINSSFSKKTKIYSPYKLINSSVDNYTYISTNSSILNTEIGKYCSIGPNLFCGMGIHPTNGISTSPMFYSTLRQNGITLSDTNKIEEWKKITIGNDVFIGANVIVLDGVTIGNGAIIGAGATVVNDIPDYAIAVGVPAKVIKYRFEADVIEKLLKIKWWQFEDMEKIQMVEKYFFSVEKFIQLHLSSK